MPVAPTGIGKGREIAGHTQAVLGRVGCRDRFFHDGDPLFEIAPLAQGPSEESLAHRQKRAQTVLLRNCRQAPRHVHERLRRPAQPHDQPPIAERKGRRMRVLQLLGRSQGVERRLQRLIDVADEEVRQAQQAATVDLGVLAEHVGGSVVPLGRIELERALQMPLGRQQFAAVLIGHPRQPMPDDACRVVRHAGRLGKKALGQGYRFGRAPARNRKVNWPNMKDRTSGVGSPARLSSMPRSQHWESSSEITPRVLVRGPMRAA